MSSVALAWAAKSAGGGYRRSSRSSVSIVLPDAVLITRLLAAPGGGSFGGGDGGALAPDRRPDRQHRPRRHAVDHARGGRVPRDGRGEHAEPAADVHPVGAHAVG